MTRSIEELTRIQHLWADAGNPDAGVLSDALEHIKAKESELKRAFIAGCEWERLMAGNNEITSDELEAAARAILLDAANGDETLIDNHLAEALGLHDDARKRAKAAITAFLEHRTKKGQGDE